MEKRERRDHHKAPSGGSGSDRNHGTAFCAIFYGLYWLIGGAVNSIWRTVSENVMIIFAGASALAVNLLFSFFYYSLVRRIKAHNLWKDCLIRKVGIAIAKGIRYAYRH